MPEFNNQLLFLRHRISPSFLLFSVSVVSSNAVEENHLSADAQSFLRAVMVFVHSKDQTIPLKEQTEKVFLENSEKHIPPKV